MALTAETNVLIRLKKVQGGINQRLDLIVAELQRLNVHLERLAAAGSRTQPASDPLSGY